MTQSRNTISFYFFLTFFLFFWGMIVSFFIMSVKRGNLGNVLSVIIMIFACSLLFGQYIWRSGQTIIIDKEHSAITFRNFFLQTAQKFHFDDFDGYATGRIKRGRLGSYKIIWLVRRGKLVNRIDEMFIRNINELETELKGLKYMGYQIITFSKRIKMTFWKISAD